MIRKLQELGCDMEGSMGRFLNDQEFYKECFLKFVEERELEKLGSVIVSGDVEEAFAQAHSLKGTLGNLGLTPIYNQMVDIVELLRQGEMSGVPQRYQELMKEWEQYKNLR
ncbi:MAG: Hpt domain-containing protein [Eubacteriales bacterium]|nr:Hpt domain-containing protein [Eubacteriales bacterium]